MYNNFHYNILSYTFCVLCIYMRVPHPHHADNFFYTTLFNIVLGGSPSSPKGPHSAGRLGTRVPILPGEWGTRGPHFGGPHSPLTPAVHIDP